MMFAQFLLQLSTLLFATWTCGGLFQRVGQPRVVGEIAGSSLAVILFLAIAGKIAGAALSARLSGISWPSATQIGILMNTRGLVELIVLNLGYREGMLSGSLFILFVLMALIRTAMTVPLLNLSERRN